MTRPASCCCWVRRADWRNSTRRTAASRAVWTTVARRARTIPRLEAGCDAPMTTATWTLEVDSNHDGVYETDLTARLIEAALQYGMQDSYQQMAPASELVLGFSNEGGAFNQDNPAATYYNKLVPGSLVRLKVVLSGVTYVQYIGQIGMGSIQPGRYNQAVTDAHRTTLHVIDPMPRLIAGEYNPPLQTSVRVDEVFQQILDTGLVPWPYDASYGLYDYSTYDNALYFID